MIEDFNTFVTTHPFVLDLIKVCLLPSLLIALNWLLDLDIARWSVKYFSFFDIIVSRTTFRDRPISISGAWDQTWALDINKSTSTTDDQKAQYVDGILKSPSFTKIKQLGRFCYAEFTDKSAGKEETYIFWGKVEGQYVYGQWYNKATDRKNNLGYFGGFQLRIKSDSEMLGLWMGHSVNGSQINTGEWHWAKQADIGFFERIKIVVKFAKDKLLVAANFIKKSLNI